MDALTHALEAYINKNGNDFTYAMAKEAIEGIIEWLPVSVNEGTLEAREKMHIISNAWLAWHLQQRTWHGTWCITCLWRYV